MNQENLSLENAQKYRKNLAKKLNRSRFVSRNNLLNIFSGLKPQEILNKAKATKEYTAAKELVLTNRKEEMKPISKFKNQTKKGLKKILENSIEFIEKGKTYYMTMVKDTKSYLDQKYGDVLLTNEYGVVIGKWDYNTLTSSYDSFLRLRGKTVPEAIISQISEQLMKFQKIDK